MIRLVVEADLKVMEIARCHTRDLSQTADGDYVLRAVTTTGKSRTVELPPSLGDQLSDLEPGYLFPGRID